MLSRLLAVILCLCVCVSHASIVSKLLHVSSCFFAYGLHLLMQPWFKEIRVLLKIWVLPSATLSKTRPIIRPRHADHWRVRLKQWLQWSVCCWQHLPWRWLYRRVKCALQSTTIADSWLHSRARPKSLLPAIYPMLSESHLLNFLVYISRITLNVISILSMWWQSLAKGCIHWRYWRDKASA